MRELQGGIIASAVFIVFLGASGLLTALLRFISPITGGLGLGLGPAHGALDRIISMLSHRSCQHGGHPGCLGQRHPVQRLSERGARAAVAVNIAIVGLSLYETGFSGVANCVQVTRAAPGTPGSAAAWRLCPSEPPRLACALLRPSGHAHDTGRAWWGEACGRWPRLRHALHAGMRACCSAALRMRARTHTHTRTHIYPRARACDARLLAAQLGLPMIAALVVFSQYLRRCALPIPRVGRCGPGPPRPPPRQRPTRLSRELAGGPWRAAPRRRVRTGPGLRACRRETARSQAVVLWL